MNLLLLEPSEIGQRLGRQDRRWEHVKKILKKRPGDELAAGIALEESFAPAPGSLGRATILELDEAGLRLDYIPGTSPPPLAPLRLILGFPRPIQAARILKELCSLGVAEIQLCGTELGEKSYLESDFFAKREFRRPLLEGAEQAGNPRLPRVETHWSLRRALESLGARGAMEGGQAPDWSAGRRLCLHPGPESPLLGSLGLEAPLSLAIGSERGWTEGELGLLRESGYEELSLGSRILRTETAATAAVALVLGRLGLM